MMHDHYKLAAQPFGVTPDQAFCRVEPGGAPAISVLASLVEQNVVRFEFASHKVAT